MLTVRDLTKIYTNRYDTQAGGVRGTSFDLPTGTFFTLLGPSGCGKTTTLRCIAGLERPDGGFIGVGDRTLFDGARGEAIPMNQRGIGMVFQSYAIWPHMTVFENIAFPLRVSKQRKYAPEEITNLVEQALATVGLSGFGERPATRLSGGQQQRVALARAIVHRPQLLLLDEPLSNLDASLREEMRAELRRLQQQIGVTTVYVTHDQSEALAMSDQIAVMDRGLIVQLGAPKDIYFRPSSAFVANFIGGANLLAGIVESEVASNHVGVLRLANGVGLNCLFPGAAAAGQRRLAAVRPESISLTAGNLDAPNILTGTIVAASFLGGTARYDIQVSDIQIQILAPAMEMLNVGETASLSIATDAAIIVRSSWTPPETAGVGDA